MQAEKKQTYKQGLILPKYEPVPGGEGRRRNRTHTDITGSASRRTSTHTGGFVIVPQRQPVTALPLQHCPMQLQVPLSMAALNEKFPE